MSSKAKETENYHELVDFLEPPIKKKNKKRSSDKSKIHERKARIHQPPKIILKDHSIEQYHYLKHQAYLKLAKEANEWIEEFQSRDIEVPSRALKLISSLLFKGQKEYFKNLSCKIERAGKMLKRF